MDRYPIGIPRLDSMIDGGAPAGSVVLLAGDAGAGAREFLHTSAILNALAQADEELFDLHYGEIPPKATVPDEIHYVSFTASPDQIRQEMGFTLDREIVDAGVDPIEFADLSDEYFHLSHVPREWYLGKTQSVTDLGESGNRRSVMEGLGDYLSSNAEDNLVLIDSLTDLVVGTDDGIDRSEVAMLVKALDKASHRWGGLILLLVNKETLTETEFGELMASSDGTLVFEWESGGSERARTLVVRQFRGVLSRLEEENIVRFETDIHDGGFDISDVRKIR